MAQSKQEIQEFVSSKPSCGIRSVRAAVSQASPGSSLPGAEVSTSSILHLRIEELRSLLKVTLEWQSQKHPCTQSQHYAATHHSSGGVASFPGAFHIQCENCISVMTSVHVSRNSVSQKQD